MENTYNVYVRCPYPSRSVQPASGPASTQHGVFWPMPSSLNNQTIWGRWWFDATLFYYGDTLDYFALDPDNQNSKFGTSKYKSLRIRKRKQVNFTFLSPTPPQGDYTWVYPENEKDNPDPFRWLWLDPYANPLPPIGALPNTTYFTVPGRSQLVVLIAYRLDHHWWAPSPWESY